MRRPDDGLPGTIRPCAAPYCRFQVQITDGGWFHIDTHGAYLVHRAAPGPVECSKRCGHLASRIDTYGDRYPICAHCFDALDAMRYGAEHGVPAPAPDATIVCEPMPEPAPLPRDYLVRVDGEFLRDTRGRLRKFTEPGAHRWADRHTPMSYSVVLLERA
jgi:hypothetical protein